MTTLLPGWKAKLDQARSTAEPAPRPRLARRYFAGQVKFVEMFGDNYPSP